MAWGDDYEKDDEQEADEEDEEALSTHNDHIICKYSMQCTLMVSSNANTAHEHLFFIYMTSKSDLRSLRCFSADHACSLDRWQEQHAGAQR
jgi:hypothetical protein